MKLNPVKFVWTNGAMVPAAEYRALAARQYHEGEAYVLDLVTLRSMISHKHYFATMHQMWLNLPEKWAKEFPTDEHFRHWALVKANYYDESNYVCDSPQHARRLAAFVRRESTFAVIRISGNTVQIFKAKSQAIDRMKGDEFQKSKTAVFETIEALTGLNPKDFEKNTRGIA